MNQGKPFIAWPTSTNGVHLVSDEPEFASHYQAIRSKEKRILTDEQVRMLPDGSGLWNATEWKIRATSSVRLLSALKQQGTGLSILEVGCGNGWLSSAMQRDGHQVTGIDPFTAELEQAARVFPNGPVFARVDLFDPILPTCAFDVIVFAASIHYFLDLKATIERCYELLRPKGTVHILDTVIYADRQAASKADLRTQAYFKDAGVPEMALHYYAHAEQDYARIGSFEILVEPQRSARFKQLLSGNIASPFTHLIYRKPE